MVECKEMVLKSIAVTQATQSTCCKIVKDVIVVKDSNSALKAVLLCIRRVLSLNIGELFKIILLSFS